ncbi:hypothetical protein B0H16DRAFT_704559 [Mycena metata]|uniref:Uncharacterized protein n=1 Tax=Mycena metata TaxID=1033252 RepID=A0AAD7GTP7_9AGAR|nr:hypothetical protein B0H16DRAFT_704559 [Mycena metata]
MTASTKHFICTSDDLDAFGIIGLLVGGSNVYSDLIPSETRDWDGLIVVARRRDIGLLVTTPSALNRMLGLVREEYPDLPVASSLHHAYDAVRYCGFNDSGVKKSVKILSLEHLSTLVGNHRPGTIRILSRKNVRVYKAAQYGRLSWRLQPAVTLDARTYLLHDADIYTAPLGVDNFQYAALGATTDLLITGKWLHATPSILGFSLRLIQKLTRVPNLRLPGDWTTFFARGERFSPRYREGLRSQQWASLLDSVATVDILQIPESLVFWHPSVFAIEQGILDHIQFFRHPQTRYRFFSQYVTNTICHRDLAAATVVPGVSPTLRETHHSRDLYIPAASRFSSNSQSGAITCGPQKLFWKIPTSMSCEIAGAHLSAPYGAIHLPLSLDVKNGILLYPFFDGHSFAERRLEHLRGIRDDTFDFIEVEMRRSEDMLTAYCGTVHLGFSDSSIQQFFCSRLMNGSRLNEFYPAGVLVNQIHCSLDDFLQLPISINGEAFPPLHLIIESALSALQLSEETVVITGMGDSHSGNVMLSKSKPMQVLYVDYETAGQHSPWLDFAKPLYNDVFFEALYADFLDRDFKAEGLFDAVLSSSGISLSIGDLKFDSTARLIWDIKRRLVLEPFTAYLLDKNLPTSLSTQILGNALFCCAILTRNYQAHPDVFLLNLALGVLLAQGRVAEVVDLVCPTG